MQYRVAFQCAALRSVRVLHLTAGCTYMRLCSLDNLSGDRSEHGIVLQVCSRLV